MWVCELFNLSGGESGLNGGLCYIELAEGEVSDCLNFGQHNQHRLPHETR